MEIKKKYSTIIISLVAACFVLSIINIFYSSSNSRLNTSISKLSEKKCNLRAEYHSQIAASNLTLQADEFNMIQASKELVRSPGGIKQVSSGLSRFIDNFNKKLSQKRYLVSGY